MWENTGIEIASQRKTFAKETSSETIMEKSDLYTTVSSFNARTVPMVKSTAIVRAVNELTVISTTALKKVSAYAVSIDFAQAFRCYRPVLNVKNYTAFWNLDQTWQSMKREKFTVTKSYRINWPEEILMLAFGKNWCYLGSFGKRIFMLKIIDERLTSLSCSTDKP